MPLKPLPADPARLRRSCGEWGSDRTRSAHEPRGRSWTTRQASEHRVSFLEPDIRNVGAVTGVPAKRRASARLVFLRLCEKRPRSAWVSGELYSPGSPSVDPQST